MKILFPILLTAAFAMAQDAKNGRRLFEKFGCYTCHGHQGQGGGAGARLTPKPISATALTAYVRHPSGSMPPYTAKVVTDSELLDIHAYLASVQPPAAIKDIPLLNQ